MRGRRLGIVVVLMAAVMANSAQGQALQGPTLPTDDFQALLGLTGTQTPAPAPVQRDEPPLRPVPRARCDRRSHPLRNGMQGRVTGDDVNSAQAARGWTCNVRVVAHHPTPGGFRVWRYVDRNHHVCAFYDTSAVKPAAVVSLAASPDQGTVVLDVTDPRKPIETDRLLGPGMLSPHESLNLNARRGLLAAELGTGGSEPGVMSIYDVANDCRHPIHLSDYDAGPTGHESGFSPDGRTFWIGGGEGIHAVDVTNPRVPHTIVSLNEWAHGLNLSRDGRTLYDTDPIDGGMAFLDVSEVQARKPDPQVREISRLTWTTSIPQNTNPVTIRGHHYLLEYDEFAFRFNPPTSSTAPGAARLIDIDDVRHPRVVSNLRLEVNMPGRREQAQNDPAFLPGPSFAYGAHYCNVPREVNPQIAACSFLNSGLRIFDIRDPRHPREAAYFVSPPDTTNGAKADQAFSQPAFDPARRQVSFTDAVSGFWTVQLSRRAWPISGR